jgi:hypothetical protein
MPHVLIHSHNYETRRQQPMNAKVQVRHRHVQSVVLRNATLFINRLAVLAAQLVRLCVCSQVGGGDACCRHDTYM